MGSIKRTGDGSGAGHVRPDTMRVVADSVGITSLAPEVANSLAPDVEYRMREIIQEALKFMRHSKRTVLTTEDINSGLRLRNVEPLYGFGAGAEPMHYSQAEGQANVYYLQDREIEFDETMNAALPKCPVEMTVVPHWLAVEGVQPAIPENPSQAADRERGPMAKRVKVESAGAGGRTGASPNVLSGVQTEIVPVAAHVLSKELQLYYERVTDFLKGHDEALRDAALQSLATDPGLHQLLPYFAQLVADEVTVNLKNLPLLNALMRCLRSLLLNPHHSVEPYLHQLIPTVLTCMVAKRLSKLPSENHWGLRDYSARTLAIICDRYGAAYPNIQPRVTCTLVRAFLDPARPLPTHYGAVQGLFQLGPHVRKLLLVPNIPTYLALLEPELSPATQKNELKRAEAMQVYGALQTAAGTCLHQFLHQRAPAPAAGSRPGCTGKSGAAGDGGEALPASAPAVRAPKPTGIKKTPALQRPPRTATEGSGVADGVAVATAAGSNDAGASGSAAVIGEAWSAEDAALGPQMESLHVVFGDSMVQFVPTPALCGVFC